MSAPSRTYCVLHSLVPVLCPPEALELELSAAITDEALASLHSFGPLPRRALIAGLASYEQGARLYPPARGRRASTLDPDIHRAYFATWWQSGLAPRRDFAHAVKGLVCMACYEMPAMQQRIGYLPNQWIQKVKRVRSVRHATAITEHRARLVAPDPLDPFQ